MTPTRHLFIPLILLVSLLSPLLDAPECSAQPAAVQATTPQPQLSTAEKKFDDTVRAFEQHLFASGAFAVDVTSEWSTSGAGQDKQGTNQFHVAVQKGGKYRIEAGSTAKGKAQYICVSDASQLLRIHRPGKYYSQRPVSAQHDDLEHDTLTLQTLAGSGVELLIRPQLRAQLVALIANVKLIGEETLEGQRVTHMQLGLIDRRQIDAWFTVNVNPILVQLKSTQKIPISAQQTIQLVTTSKFQWKIGGSLPAETFTETIPSDARRVDNLLTALRSGDVRQLLGTPAPLLELTDTKGKLVRLADYRGKKVIVLIFWASWCAPSTNKMESLNTFVAEAEKGGAVVLAVNLGETPAQVQKTVTEFKYTGTVLLDPETKSLDAYRFGELPTTIMIGKDGTVQSLHSGSTSNAREAIRRDAAVLLQGKSLVPVK